MARERRGLQDLRTVSRPRPLPRRAQKLTVCRSAHSSERSLRWGDSGSDASSDAQRTPSPAPHYTQPVAVHAWAGAVPPGSSAADHAHIAPFPMDEDVKPSLAELEGWEEDLGELMYPDWDPADEIYARPPPASVYAGWALPPLSQLVPPACAVA